MPYILYFALKVGYYKPLVMITKDFNDAKIYENLQEANGVANEIKNWIETHKIKNPGSTFDPIESVSVKKIEYNVTGIDKIYYLDNARCCEIPCKTPVKWVRCTQFFGNHFYCLKHAKKQKNFKKEDSTDFFWEKYSDYLKRKIEK